MTQLGIDIASVDGNRSIDWHAAHAAGISFAFIRGTYGTWPDPTWINEAQRARDARLTVGAYLFPLPGPANPPVAAQVKAFAAAVKLAPLDFAPALDVEFPHGIKGTGLSRDDLCQWLTDAIVALRDAYGCWPIVYTSSRVWDGNDTDCLDGPMGLPVAECPTWLARYPWKRNLPWTPSSGPPPLGPRAWHTETPWIHQYQGDARGMPGFSSTVDMNVFLPAKQPERIRWIQRRVGAAETGWFDDATVAAVKAWQSWKGLTADGVVGVRTFAALSRVMPR